MSECTHDCAACGEASSSATAANCTYSIGRAIWAASEVAPRFPVDWRACAAIRKNAASINGPTDQRSRTHTNSGRSSNAPAPQKTIGGTGAQMPTAVPAMSGKAKPTTARRRGGRGRRSMPLSSSSIHGSTNPPPERPRNLLLLIRLAPAPDKPQPA